MTTGTPDQSEEELVKRLQIVLRDASDAGEDTSRTAIDLREARNLAAELAQRIHAQPDTWGISAVPEKVRDEAAAEAFLELLSAIPRFRGREAAAEWFAEALSNAAAGLADERPPVDREQDALPSEGGADLAVFEGGDTPWARFEQEYTDEAFALRLRYLLRRPLEDIVDILSLSDVRAVERRLNRARDRFQACCQEAGLGRGETADLMRGLTEEEG